jgi:hypothetical protein
MFATREEAVRELASVFGADDIAVIARLLCPCIGFAEAPDLLRIGGTRMGGLPDLLPEIVWPIRAVPHDVERIAGFGGSNHAEHIRKHIAQPLPYPFIAQIDLAEAASVFPGGGVLPDHGRLLLFCDLPVIPWRDGVDSCRVIWDRSRPEALVRADVPPVLQSLADESIAEMRIEFEKHGLSTDALSHAYWGASRPMRLKIVLALPDAGAPEAGADPAFAALMEDEETSDAYSDFVSERTHDRPEGVERHRMLGYPTPEQDDPRYAAVALVDYGVSQFWDWADRPDQAAIMERMKDWHLLFQCDLSDYYQDRLSEGTVYFLIRDDHLRTRNFDRTVAVYQQT